MSQEITKTLKCVQMRSGVELWVDGEAAGKIQIVLQNITAHKFIHVKELDQTLNTADIVGVFSAGTMEDNTRRKNGQFKCLQGKWHDRGTKCDCPDKALQERFDERDRLIKNCKRGCVRGFIKSKDSDAMTYCECIRDLIMKFNQK